MEQTEFAHTRVKLWGGSDSAILLKIATYDRQGQKLLSQSFTYIELDLSGPGSLFAFTQPEGIQVVDMTEATAIILKSMSCQERSGGPGDC